MNSCKVYKVNRPNILSGSLLPSPSKSQTLRAILFASIANGTSKIYNILNSPDQKAMIAACMQLGADIKYIDTNSLIIQGVSGNLKQPKDIIDAGNSGIVLRFITAICGLLNNYVVVTGDDSIKNNRKIKPLLLALEQLGVEAKSLANNDYAPVIIKGLVINNKDENISVNIDGHDSQPVSALIIASLLIPKNITINVNNPGEKPWLDVTLEWLDRLNLQYDRYNYDTFIIKNNNKCIPAFEYTVPSDLSSISFPIAAALVTNSKIILENIDLSDPQGDKIIIDIFNNMGADIKYNLENKNLVVNKHNGLIGTSVDINNCIDVIAILAVVACYAKGKTIITGAKIARTKECDRIKCITTELKKAGANIIEYSDGLEVIGGKLNGCNNFNTYNDHRMVMSLFVASLGCEQDFSIIDNIESVNKSYPKFFADMKSIGCRFEI